MIKHLHFLFTSLFVLISLSANAQAGFCGFDGIRDSDLSTNPVYERLESIQNQQLQDYLNLYGQRKMNAAMVVPVVFHVVHQNGPENVPDSILIQALNNLNLSFRNAPPLQHPDGHDANIQFCLASVDPNGFPTNGITRDTSYHTHISTYTNGAEDIALKNVNRWAPALYLNVWVVASIGGASGYATFPFAGNDLRDGIVVSAYTLTNPYVLAHEAGHYFNLYHTFQGGCPNDNCQFSGDHVCDTPPDNDSNNSCGLNSCSTELADTSGYSPFTSDVNDLPDYMDYTSCPLLMFTQGQVSRMQAALVQFRTRLLQSNGCGSHPGGLAPVASFTIDTTICNAIRGFKSTSANNLFTVWDLDGNGTWDAVGDSVRFTYPSSGTYTVKMACSGFGGSDTLVQSVYIRTPPFQTYPVMNTYTGISIDPFLHTHVTCKGTTMNFEGVNGMASYQWSNGETTRSVQFVADSSYFLSLVAIDSSGYPWKSCYPLYADVNLDSLHLISYVGNTIHCGQYVLVLMDPQPYYNLPRNFWYRDGVLVAQNQFSYPFVPSIPGQYNYWMTNTDINNCVLNSDTISFVLPTPALPALTLRGDTLVMNYDCTNITWYKNGVPFMFAQDSFLVTTGPGCYYARCEYCGWNNSDTVCIYPVGTQSLSQEDDVMLSPNPTNGLLHLLSKNNLENTSIQVFNALGKLILVEKAMNTETIIDLSHFPAGIYWVKLGERRWKVVRE